jgi:hypothetical protein
VTETPNADAPLTWAVVANVSRDLFVRQRTDTKRPGTRHFVPGAKVWVLPVLWGDGGEKRYVVGTHRDTGGRGLIRLVMNTDYLVNYRVKPVYSPALYAAMGQPWDVDPRRHEVDAPKLYESREAAQQTADSWKWTRTRAPHLAITEWTSAMHNADEACEFCDGRDAAQAGDPADANPYLVPEVQTEGTVGWWSTDHGMWRCGWLTETYVNSPDHLSDLGLRHLALARRKLRRDAEWLARDADGKTVAELEARGIGRDRLRFVRGEFQPRRVDGVVHAWLSDAEHVVRTQFG